MMNRTELKTEELEQVAGGGVLEFFIRILALIKWFYGGKFICVRKATIRQKTTIREIRAGAEDIFGKI